MLPALDSLPGGGWFWPLFAAPVSIPPAIPSAYGGTRRVKGPRREEVCLLAGVSIDYYVRMERGNLSGVSDVVLESVARALQLDDAERAHPFNLARKPVSVPPARRRPSPQVVRPGLLQVLDAIPDTAAWFVFLDPASKEFFGDWDRAADDIAAMLRQEAGKNPHDKALTGLIGELSTRSDDFRQRWAAHNVRFHRTRFKKLHHPVVGNLELNFEAMEFPSDPGLTMLVYTAAAGTPTADALKLPASWTSTQELARRGIHLGHDG